MAASAPPVVSADGRTVTVRLRHGVRFSPPVDREVTSADVKYAFDRIFSANVAAPYASYFRALEGAPAKPTKGVQSRVGHHDARPVHGRLPAQARQRADVRRRARAAGHARRCPEEYAKPFDAKTPSTYNEHVVATGPYMVAQRRVRAG